MTKRTDRNYLLNQQYNNAANLNARIKLHTLFTSNPYDWFHFVFDHFFLPDEAEIIELGCGPGILWVKNRDRIPPGWNITLSDFSPGMLDEAQKNLAFSDHPFHFRIIDAQELPIANEQLDAVIANHMVYHIPDRLKAFSEVHRVLKPGGYFYTGTNGEQHLAELRPWYDILVPGMSKGIDCTFSSGTFTLENGPEQLSHWFETERCDYDGSLIVTEAQPLVEYILSMVPSDTVTVNDAQVDHLYKQIKSRIRKSGCINITKSTGLLISRKK